MNTQNTKLKSKAWANTQYWIDREDPERTYVRIMKQVSDKTYFEEILHGFAGIDGMSRYTDKPVKCTLTIPGDQYNITELEEILPLYTEAIKILKEEQKRFE